MKPKLTQQILELGWNVAAFQANVRGSFDEFLKERADPVNSYEILKSAENFSRLFSKHSLEVKFIGKIL